MCVRIIINRGEKEIETPRQFEEHFGFKPEMLIASPLSDESILMDYCLCPCDLEKSFNDHDIKFKFLHSDGDYYVGQLDQIKEI